MKKSKENYLEKQKANMKDNEASRLPYKAIKYIKSKEKPKRWSLNDLNPEMPDQELSTSVATYFNKISNEFRSLQETDLLNTYEAFKKLLEPYEVANRIKKIKKESMVEGIFFQTLLQSTPISGPFHLQKYSTMLS